MLFLIISERNSSSDAFGLSFGQCNEAQPSGMPDELGRIKVDGNNKIHKPRSEKNDRLHEYTAKEIG